MRHGFAKRDDPVISLDSKKKEQVGNFKNAGVAWKQKPVETFDHDFRSMAKGIAIPYGIFDTVRNRGFVVVGTSSETPTFAVDCLVAWWMREGKNYVNVHGQ